MADNFDKWMRNTEKRGNAGLKKREVINIIKREGERILSA